MKILYLSALLLAFFTTPLVAQTKRNCGTMTYLEAQLTEDPGLQERMEQIEQEIGQWTGNNATERNQSVITIPAPVTIFIKSI